MLSSKTLGSIATSGCEGTQAVGRQAVLLLLLLVVVPYPAFSFIFSGT